MKSMEHRAKGMGEVVERMGDIVHGTPIEKKIENKEPETAH